METTCSECGEEARFWADYDTRHEFRPRETRPEPAITTTGHIVAVEWEHEDGGRWWSTIDEGRLDHEIWSNRQIGVYLSDVDELAA